jgi:hypothetical protein
VGNQTTAAWDEEHMCGWLAWLYDGFALPTEHEQRQVRAWRGRLGARQILNARELST